MSEKEKNEKWFEHYSKYGIAFIAPQMQAIVKRAFFEGMVAVEHRVEQTAKPCIVCGSTLVGYCRSGCTALC